MNNTIKQQPIYAQFARGAARTGLFVANEVREAAENDPALAMRLSVGQLIPPILSGYSPEANAITDQWMAPVVRVGLLAVNANRAMNSVRNESTSRIEKGIDILCATADAIGVLGAWGALAFPAYHALGAYAVGAANAVDIMTHSVRGLAHLGRRTKAWEASLAADKPDDKPDNKPDNKPDATPPAAPPTPPKVSAPAAPSQLPFSWNTSGNITVNWGQLPGKTGN